MGIRLRPASLNDEFEYISLHDDALDGDAEDFAEKFAMYREGTKDSPPLKEGKEPTRFILRPLVDAQLRGKLEGVREEHGRSAWFIATACVCLRSASGLKYEDGKPFKIKHDRVDGYETVIKEQQDLLGAPLLTELGMIVHTHELPKND